MKEQLEKEIVSWLGDLENENRKELLADNELMIGYIDDAENILENVLGLLRRI